MARFGRMLTAMITPFDDDGDLDVDGAVALATWLVQQGNEGLVVCGTTGESPTLTDDEKLTLFETVSEAVTVPVIAGSTGNDTAHSCHLTIEASKRGVAGILALCPYYNRPSQAGIELHVRAIAEVTDLPLMIYDIPIRTGRKIDTPVLNRLSHEVLNVVAVKDASGNPAETARLIAAAADGFEVYSGDDAFTLPLLAVGAVGTVSVAGHWVTPVHVEMLDAWEAGDTAEARRLNALMLPSFAFETGDACPNPGPSKAMLRILGQPAGHCRPPMGPDSDGLEDEARRIYEALQADRG
ncbi:MAG: 4-hydroxy-tetrahydrodipicolinate synthase [Acidimicrobiia bacterium]|nr:4-hydroxy-tetrahydrodipicolinate synthase [Acidimicrobiia bacterium]